MSNEKIQISDEVTVTITEHFPMPVNPFEVVISTGESTVGDWKVKVFIDDVELPPVAGFNLKKGSFEFEVLPSDLATWVQAQAGTYVQFSNDNSMIMSANFSLNSAWSLINDKKHKFVLACDNYGELTSQLQYNECVMEVEVPELLESWSATPTKPYGVKITFG